MSLARSYGSGAMALLAVLVLLVVRAPGDPIGTMPGSDAARALTTRTVEHREAPFPPAGPDSPHSEVPALAGADVGAAGHGMDGAFGREDRLDAIAAIGEDRSRRAALKLRSLLDDPDLAVREEAVETLAVRGGPGVIAGLAYALSDADALIRRLAIEGLAGDGRDAAVGALALVLYDKDARLRRLAVDELAELDSDAARLVLQQFIADPDPAIGKLAEAYLDGNCQARNDDAACRD